MATDVADDREMREAQRDYLDFLDDDVSLFLLNSPKVFVWSWDDKTCGHNKRAVIWYSTEKKCCCQIADIRYKKSVFKVDVFQSYS